MGCYIKRPQLPMAVEPTEDELCVSMGCYIKRPQLRSGKLHWEQLNQFRFNGLLHQTPSATSSLIYSIGNAYWEEFQWAATSNALSYFKPVDFPEWRAGEEVSMGCYIKRPQLLQLRPALYRQRSWVSMGCYIKRPQLLEMTTIVKLPAEVSMGCYIKRPQLRRAIRSREPRQADQVSMGCYLKRPQLLSLRRKFELRNRSFNGLLHQTPSATISQGGYIVCPQQ